MGTLLVKWMIVLRLLELSRYNNCKCLRLYGLGLNLKVLFHPCVILCELMLKASDDLLLAFWSGHLCEFMELLFKLPFKCLSLRIFLKWRISLCFFRFRQCYNPQLKRQSCHLSKILYQVCPVYQVSLQDFCIYQHWLKQKQYPFFKPQFTQVMALVACMVGTNQLQI